MRLTISLCVAFVLAVISMGLYVNHVSYIDNSRYWGIPYHATRDAAGVLALKEVRANMQESLNSLPSSIAKHIQEVKSLQEQQKYLYNKLFNATVDLEKNSMLDMSLISRIGPNANMYLKDLTKTDEAMAAISSYETKLTPDSPLRDEMANLRMALNQESKSKSEYHEKMAKFHIEEFEREMLRVQEEARLERIRQEREYQLLMNPPAQPEPQIIIRQSEPEPEPIPEVIPEADVENMNARTSTVIDTEDGKKLGLTHIIMANIELTQIKMVSVVKEIVREHELIGIYNAQVNTKTPDQMLVVGAQLPVTYMFIRKRTLDICKLDKLYTYAK